MTNSSFFFHYYFLTENRVLNNSRKLEILHNTSATFHPKFRAHNKAMVLDMWIHCWIILSLQTAEDMNRISDLHWVFSCTFWLLKHCRLLICWPNILTLIALEGSDKVFKVGMVTTAIDSELFAASFQPKTTNTEPVFLKSCSSQMYPLKTYPQIYVYTLIKVNRQNSTPRSGDKIYISLLSLPWKLCIARWIDYQMVGWLLLDTRCKSRTNWLRKHLLW